MWFSNLCLVFDLPSGAGGMAPAMASAIIIKKMNLFSNSHNIPYRKKIKKYELCIWFPKDEDYTLFSLIYDHNDDWRRFQIKVKDYDGN